MIMLRTALRPLQVSSPLSQLSRRRNISMTTFSDPSFDFKGYLENRPRYPDSLYNAVLSFHKGQTNTILDLGCGPGLSLFPFAYHFRTLIGTDPSQGMMAEAQGAWEAWKNIQDGSRSLEANQVDFKMLSAENLTGIEDESIDLITAATAVHWFDYPAIWPELARVLKSSGTVAFWTYGSNYLPQHPNLAPMMMEFMNSHSDKMGPYWPQPGRSILESLLADVPFPFQLEDVQSKGKWDESSATRIAHKLESPGIPDLAWARGEAEEEKFRMEQVMTFKTLNGYFHTSSASSRYFKAFPELKMEKPDMIDRHTEKLRDCVLKERAQKIGNLEGLDDDHIRVAWPLGLMMIRKK